MVYRWQLWRGCRRRGKITSAWLNSIRFDCAYTKRHGFQLVSWAVMVTRGGKRCAGPTQEVKMPKKPDETTRFGVTAARAADPGQMFAKLPILGSYLVDLFYEGGTETREPGYMLVRARDGKWHLTLKDPSEGRQVRLMVTEPGTMWAAMEALLASGTCPWEPDGWAGKSKKKK